MEDEKKFEFFLPLAALPSSATRPSTHSALEYGPAHMAAPSQSAVPALLQYLPPDAAGEAVPEGPHVQPGHNGYRAWVFVLNNPPDDAPARLPQLGSPLWPGLERFVYQLERGERGTLHIQGYVNFGRTQRSFTWMRHGDRLGPRCHIEPAKGTPEQNYAYCTKLATRVGEPKFGGFDGHGVAVGRGRRGISKRAEIVALIAQRPDITRREIIDAGGLDVLVDRPNILGVTRGLLREDERAGGVVCYLFYGASGCGKSRLAHHLFPGAYRKSSGKWWEHYAGESTVILDDFDAHHADIGDFLRIIDRYALIVECKNGSFPLAANRFVVTSNLLPPAWYPEAGDRLAAVQRRIDFVVTFNADGRSTTTIPGEQFFRGHPSPFDVPPVVSDLPWADLPVATLPNVHFGDWARYDAASTFLPQAGPPAPVGPPAPPPAPLTPDLPPASPTQPLPRLEIYPEPVSDDEFEIDDDWLHPLSYPHTPRVFASDPFAE